MLNKWTILFYLVTAIYAYPSFEGCQFSGDGYCDDQYNVIQCNFDGGDCCREDIKRDYCTECICHDVLMARSALDERRAGRYLLPIIPKEMVGCITPGHFRALLISYNLG